MNCPVCNRHMSGHTIMHHFYWPKKKHRGRNRLMEVHIKCEKAYHQFWYDHCQKRTVRTCDTCRYTRICYCYKN